MITAPEYHNNRDAQLAFRAFFGGGGMLPVDIERARELRRTRKRQSKKNTTRKRKTP